MKHSSDEILEGEVVSEASPSHPHKPPPIRPPLNCTAGCLIFVAAVVTAIVTKNPLFLLLGIFLPLWIFSRKK